MIAVRTVIDGTPIVILHQTDLVNHSSLAPVAKAQLEAAGFKVDMQSMDWQTLVARRTKKEPAAQGGWHMFATSSATLSIPDPVSNFFLSASCEKSMFGWPCDVEIEKLRAAYARETDEDTRQRATAVLTALKQGADFAELAVKYSDGPESMRGGNIGFVRQGELLPQIERALSALEAGQVTDTIETDDGWHIFRLDEKRPPQFRPFAEVKTEIQTLVYQQKTEDVYQVWLGDLKNKSFIEVKF